MPVPMRLVSCKIVLTRREGLAYQKKQQIIFQGKQVFAVHGEFLRSMISLGVFLFACVIQSFAGHAAYAESPTEAIQGTITKAIAILEDPAWKKPEKLKARRQKLETLIGERFNYEEMAKRSLGEKQWRSLASQEKQNFVQLFTGLLASSYADKIEGYSGQQIEYLKERKKGKYAEVQTKVRSGKTEIPLDYRMRDESNNWEVYDVVVDGVSLVRNYRGQFSKVIKQSSYQDLVKKLREKMQQSSGS